MALVWCLPQALMAAELSLMMDVNGGNVVWVQRAFGDYLGFVNSHACLWMSLASQSIVVVIFVAYLPGSQNYSVLTSWLMRTAFVIVISLINVWGVKWLSRVSTLCLIFILLPFLFEVAMVFNQGYESNIDKVFSFPPMNQVDWATLVSTVIWANGGYDSLGSMAGEVEGGKRTFLLGLLGAFPLILLNYIVPIIFGYMIVPEMAKWSDGYFSTAAAVLAPWLGYWLTAASAVSNFTQFSAYTVTTARVVWAMAVGEDGMERHLPFFLGWSWQRYTGTIRPIAAIVFSGAVSLALSGLPFNFLVQFYLLIRIINLLLEYAALIYLRYSEPDTPRPYRVPCGMFGAWAVGFPSLVISIVAIVFADRLALTAGSGTLGAILLLGLMRSVYRTSCTSSAVAPDGSKLSAGGLDDVGPKANSYGKLQADD
eukprot:gnl/Spiro4/14155_TR7609_c0_g1_i1.p1 gnl/Spiro4/14155_TR7609_c0_g1~~gnl/Spiro4/14155_TR7609_c0_g1_i1.p1  ORF type:complete len:426 (-),score=96.36 gnl/Spiro4/14155_TR7609_c0_g1_i1:177-1454(-)